MNKFSNDRFFEACGGREPLKVLLQDFQTKSESVFTFAKPNILVGSNEAADIRLKRSTCSSRQIYLQILDGRLFCIGLSQQLPTYWGDDNVSSGWITSADVIRFGTYRLRLLEGVLDESETMEARYNPMVSASSRFVPLRLEYKSSTPQRLTVSLNRTLSLVGSSSLCKLRIRNRNVSSNHCSLVRTTTGAWVADLGGRGGIRVNQNATPISSLESGDLLDIGGNEFRIDYQASQNNIVPDDGMSIMPRPHPRNLISQDSVASAPHGQEYFQQVVDPIIRYFADYQNQTFQQFHDLMGNVLQMFGSVFKQQQDYIQEEMKRFDQLSEELNSIRCLLKSMPASYPFAEESIPDSQQVPGSTGDQNANLVPSTLDIPLAPTFAEVLPDFSPKPSSPVPQTPFDPNSAALDRDMHVWLQSRIAQIQTEQQGLWSRLTSMIRGR